MVNKVSASKKKSLTGIDFIRAQIKKDNATALRKIRTELKKKTPNFKQIDLIAIRFSVPLKITKATGAYWIYFDNKFVAKVDIK